MQQEGPASFFLASIVWSRGNSHDDQSNTVGTVPLGLTLCVNMLYKNTEIV